MTGAEGGTAEAQRALRDVLSLLTLPALWVGKDADTIFQLITEAVDSIVHVDFSFIDVQVLAGRPPLQALRLARFAATPGERDAWQPAVEAMRRLPLSMLPNEVDTPLGRLRVLRLSVGFTGQGGSFWFGSRHPAFPSAAEAALLRAAVTLAATGLQAVRLDHERQRASRAKDEFLAMLGHELRNPLAPIFNSLALIQMQSGAPLAGPHAVIERQARHLARLVDDLLDVSRIASGKIELDRQSLVLRAILSDAIEAVEPLVSERKHQLTAELPPDTVRISADVTRIRQVFINLLTNAAKYTSPGGLIHVRTELREGQVLVHIRDNGMGIPAELKGRIFHIFEQGPNAIDRAVGGLGVGLALVKNFVQLHGGEVDVASDGPGQGATFTVRLPLEPDAQPQPKEGQPPAAAPAEAKTGLRVMLVDDNLDALESMAMALELSGFEVATASRPEDALALAQRFRPQVAVLDIGLPGMSGYELAVRLREVAGAPDALRLISLSGYGQAIDHHRSAEAGLARHLVKPVGLDELIQVIQA